MSNLNHLGTEVAGVLGDSAEMPSLEQPAKHKLA